MSSRRLQTVIEQINGEFGLKETALVKYRTAIQKLIKSLSSIQFEHVPQSQNKYVDPLATLASKEDIRNETTNVKIMKKTLQPTTTELIPKVLTEEEDQRTSIIQKLSQPSSSVIMRELKDLFKKRRTIFSRKWRNTSTIFSNYIFENKSQNKIGMCSQSLLPR